MVEIGHLDMQGKWIIDIQYKEREKEMLVKLVKITSQLYQIDVEEVEARQKHILTCPLGIFQRVQAWGMGTIMEVDVQDNIVKSVVRRDPVQ